MKVFLLGQWISRSRSSVCVGSPNVNRFCLALFFTPPAIDFQLNWRTHTYFRYTDWFESSRKTFFSELNPFKKIFSAYSMAYWIRNQEYFIIRFWHHSQSLALKTILNCLLTYRAVQQLCVVNPFTTASYWQINIWMQQLNFQQHYSVLQYSCMCTTVSCAFFCQKHRPSKLARTHARSFRPMAHRELRSKKGALSWNERTNEPHSSQSHDNISII